ncbi:MAG: radical SAM protein [Deltaproteobacteria bacterium]|nr:radical SAM protein [Deltaproteobacteria bacterium]
MSAPECPFLGLDTLWIQAAGLACNLRCAHCFNASGPGNREMEPLSSEEVRALLDEAEAAGVRDVVFTGGEPFLLPDMADIGADAVLRFPVTILTNGTLLSGRTVDRLAKAAGGSRFSLEIRISLDAPAEEANDAIRGKGSFAKTVEGAARLEAAGILPIVTAVRLRKDDGLPEEEELEGFEGAMRAAGIRKPRVKFLPVFRIGREEERGGGYADSDRVTGELLDLLGADNLLCSTARLATSRGVWPCPILVNEMSARMGDDLRPSFRPFPLAYGACSTCLRHGAVCANIAPSLGGR